MLGRRSLGSNFGPICRNNIHSHRITRFHWYVKIAAALSLVTLSFPCLFIGSSTKEKKKELKVGDELIGYEGSVDTPLTRVLVTSLAG